MKNKVSNALKNKNKSEEHKLKLKEAKGKEDKQYRSFINGNNRRGKKHSKETIEKIIKNTIQRHKLNIFFISNVKLFLKTLTLVNSFTFDNYVFIPNFIRSNYLHIYYVNIIKIIQYF